MRAGSLYCWSSVNLHRNIIIIFSHYISTYYIHKYNFRDLCINTYIPTLKHNIQQ